jgi:hypothetical protein
VGQFERSTADYSWRIRRNKVSGNNQSRRIHVTAAVDLAIDAVELFENREDNHGKQLRRGQTAIDAVAAAASGAAALRQ